MVDLREYAKALVDSFMADHLDKLLVEVYCDGCGTRVFVGHHPPATVRCKWCGKDLGGLWRARRDATRKELLDKVDAASADTLKEIVERLSDSF